MKDPEKQPHNPYDRLPSSLTNPDPEPLPIGQQVPEEYRWIKPTLGRVVLRELPPEERRKGSGLYLVSLSPQGGSICEVAEVCDSYASAEDDQDPSKFGPQFARGQLVIIGKFSGTDVTLDGKKYIMCNESDVLGVLTKEKPEG